MYRSIENFRWECAIHDIVLKLFRLVYCILFVRYLIIKWLCWLHYDRFLDLGENSYRSSVTAGFLRVPACRTASVEIYTTLSVGSWLILSLLLLIAAPPRLRGCVSWSNLSCCHHGGLRFCPHPPPLVLGVVGAVSGSSYINEPNSVIVSGRCVSMSRTRFVSIGLTYGPRIMNLIIVLSCSGKKWSTARTSLSDQCSLYFDCALGARLSLLVLLYLRLGISLDRVLMRNWRWQTSTLCS